MTNQECPNIVKCPLYAKFQMASTKETITILYCKGKYEDCARKKLKDAGQPVPEKLMPNGQYMK